MKNYKVTLRIETTEQKAKTTIEHSDTFPAKNAKDAEKQAIETAKKDLVFNCKITVLKTVEV